MKLFFLMLSLIVGGAAQAQVVKVNVAKEFPVGAKVNTKSSLGMLKSHEDHLKWAECVKLAPQVFASHKDLRGWVALTWLHCLDESQKKAKNQAAIDKALAVLQEHPELRREGPWASSLEKNWVNLKLLQLEGQVARKNRKAEVALDSLLQSSASMSAEQKVKAYQLLGDLALLENDLGKAQFLFEQAQDQKDSKYLQEKLSYIAKARGALPVSEKAASVQGTEVAGAETQIEERLRAALKQNDPLSAVKDVIVLLNEYPGSRAAKRLKDKPLEIYNSLSDTLVKAKVLVEMESADSSRLMDWAQSLHRRADFLASMALAQKFLQQSPSSPASTSALWIVGRSAHFLGQYDRALESYSRLFTYHSGTEEAAEALFRSALIYYRKKEYSTSAALLERLLQQGRERYELNARYWFVRALQESKSERALAAAKELMENYPFSYYGLRLRAESSQGVLSWPENKESAPVLTQEFYLVGAQKNSWSRIKQLANAGWAAEAQQELVGLPFMKDVTLKVALAEKLVARQQYLTAIRWVNEALEADPRLRREQFVKISFPEAFSSLFAAEAGRYGVDAILFKSLTRQESGFNQRAVSSSNALGLMQMIPPTAQEVARKLGLKLELPDDMFRPEVNIPMGTYYISQMLDQFSGHVPVALAAYNAGPTRVKLWLEARPELRESLDRRSSAPVDEIWFDELPWSETSFYVKAILRNILLYRLSEKGRYNVNLALWQDLLEKRAK